MRTSKQRQRQRSPFRTKLSRCSKGVCSCRRIFRTNHPGALLEEEFNMQKREGRKSLQKRENQIQSTCGGWSLTERGYFLCVKGRDSCRSVLSGSENGNLKKFSSHYFYFLNEVKQMKSSGRASIKRRREMWNEGRKCKIIILRMVEFTRETL